MSLGSDPEPHDRMLTLTCWVSVLIALEALLYVVEAFHFLTVGRDLDAKAVESLCGSLGSQG